MENFERKYAPVELWSYFIDILAFELGKLCPGVGILFGFSDPGAGVLHWKAVPGAGILMEKISGPAVSPGGGDGNGSNWYLHYFKDIEAIPCTMKVEQSLGNV